MRGTTKEKSKCRYVSFRGKGESDEESGEKTGQERWSNRGQKEQ